MGWTGAAGGGQQLGIFVPLSSRFTGEDPGALLAAFEKVQGFARLMRVLFGSAWYRRSEDRSPTKLDRYPGHGRGEQL